MKAPTRSEANIGDTIAPRGTPCELPLSSIVPDESNRVIDETDEEFIELTDSIRVLGVLQRVHVQARGDGTYVLIDGERRWRASQRAGCESIAAEVWPEGSHPRDAVIAGLILNEQRKAHGAVHVARRLRLAKNQFAETQEQLAQRTGMPIARVKLYLSIFNASDHLLAFFEKDEVPLRVAAEFMRYEKGAGEAAARRLVARYRESAMSYQELLRLRTRGGTRSGETEKTELPAERRRAGFAGRIDAAFRRDATAALLELRAVAQKLGYELVEARSHDEKVAL